MYPHLGPFFPKRPGHNTLMYLCVFKQQRNKRSTHFFTAGDDGDAARTHASTFSCLPPHSLSSLLPPASLRRAHPSFHISCRVLLELDSLKGGKFLLSASARCRVCRIVHARARVKIIPPAFFDWLSTNLCFGLCR